MNTAARKSTEIVRSIPCGDLNEVLDELQGSAYFEKRLSATNAQRPSLTNRHAQLSMPKRFVVEHGNKFRRAVELRSDLSGNKPWPQRLSFCTSRITPEVTFAGARWERFVTAHDLVQGDQLIFSLTAMSQFQVYVFDAFGNPKGPQTVHMPVNWSEAIKRPHESLAFGKSVKKTSETAICTRKGNFLLNGGIACLPSFSRTLVAINVHRLEIPKRFVAAYGSQLHDPVQLQGIYDESPTLNNVRCFSYISEGRDRILLKWEDFVRKNKLCLGQELVFTLTADSCFTVREQISWSPQTGLNLCSHVPMSVQKSGAESLSIDCVESKQ